MQRAATSLYALVLAVATVTSPALSEEPSRAPRARVQTGAPDAGGSHTLRLMTSARGLQVPERPEAPIIESAFVVAIGAAPHGLDFRPAPGEIVIDVLVAYTRMAADHYADITADLIDRAIDAANQSFRLSNLRHIRLRLVHAYQTNYLESGDHFDHVWRFADRADGYMDEVHVLRETHRADVALLVVHDPKGCGLATRVHADADEAFAVVHHECATTNYTFAHEIGHLIGASHDLSYVHANTWRDIMGLKESCGGCPRLPIWSNPDVLVDGEPAGAAYRNNARVIAEQAPRVAAFR